MQVEYLGGEDPLEEGMATHSSVVAWRIPWTEEPGGLWFMELQKVEHNWSNLAQTPTPLFLTVSKLFNLSCQPPELFPMFPICVTLGNSIMSSLKMLCVYTCQSRGVDTEEIVPIPIVPTILELFWGFNGMVVS